MAFNKNPKIEINHIDTYEYESVNETGNSVVVDMYDGEEKKHQSPTELLLTAVATCSAVDTVEILKKRKKSFSSFKIQANGDRNDDHPRYFKSIHLHFIVESTNVKKEELEKHATTVVDKYCSVATTVSGTAKITVTAEII